MHNKNVLSIQTPSDALPLIFDSPHSGTIYPDDFDYICEFSELKKAADTYVDELFDFVPRFGGHFLCAHFPRSYIDVNRCESDVDINLLSENWPEHDYGPITPSIRSNAGIGLIRRLVRPGVPVYNRDLSPAEIWNRIQNYYWPYHNALENLFRDTHYNFGEVWHINCHSMPHSSASPRQAIGLLGRKSQPVDFVIGDRDGTTADIAFSHAIRDCLKSMGYSVSLNDPFKGVELVHRYSQPTHGLHSIQLEINKSLYMNEESGEKNKYYNALKDDLNKLVSFIADYVRANLMQKAAD